MAAASSVASNPSCCLSSFVSSWTDFVVFINSIQKYQIYCRFPRFINSYFSDCNNYIKSATLSPTSLFTFLCIRETRH